MAVAARRIRRIVHRESVISAAIEESIEAKDITFMRAWLSIVGGETFKLVVRLSSMFGAAVRFLLDLCGPAFAKKRVAGLDSSVKEMHTIQYCIYCISYPVNAKCP